jgi:hypothetical protein
VRTTASWLCEGEQCTPPAPHTWKRFQNDDLSLRSFIAAHYGQKLRCVSSRYFFLTIIISSP